MSAEPILARPSETPTNTPRAFVDSATGRRCPWCCKKMVEEVRNNTEGVPVLVEFCLNCDEWSTSSETDESDPLFGIDLTPLPFCDEEEVA